jgi:hypothetical protein
MKKNRPLVLERLKRGHTSITSPARNYSSEDAAWLLSFARSLLSDIRRTHLSGLGIRFHVKRNL